jgi:hypothetical protein
MSDGGDDAATPLVAHVRVVRLGHGANCSSVGSVIDTLFASAVVGGAIFAAVAAALAREEVRVVPGGRAYGVPPQPPRTTADAEPTPPADAGDAP